jgi:hypothetical protein
VGKEGTFTHDVVGVTAVWAGPPPLAQDKGGENRYVRPPLRDAPAASTTRIRYRVPCDGDVLVG